MLSDSSKIISQIVISNLSVVNNSNYTVGGLDTVSNMWDRQIPLGWEQERWKPIKVGCLVGKVTISPP